MLFQPWFLVPFGASWLFRVVLEATADSLFPEDEYMGSLNPAFVLDLLDEYQSLLLEFLYADFGVVFCLMLLWGAQALSNWLAPSGNLL